MVKICLQCRRPGFDPWDRKIPWRRAWQCTPVFLPGKSHGQRNLAGYKSMGLQRVRHDFHFHENLGKDFKCKFLKPIPRHFLSTSGLVLRNLNA